MSVVESHQTTMLRILLVATGMLFAATAFAAPQLEDGEWEFTMKMDMPGMPVEMPPVRFQNCLSKDDPIPKQREEMRQDCKMLNQKIVGNTVSYTMHCANGDITMENTAETTFSGATMKGSMHQTMKQGGEVIHSTNGTMTGKRIGPCAKK